MNAGISQFISHFKHLADGVNVMTDNEIRILGVNKVGILTL